MHQQPTWLRVDRMVSSTHPPSCTNSLPGCAWTGWSAPLAHPRAPTACLVVRGHDGQLHSPTHPRAPTACLVVRGHDGQLHSPTHPRAPTACLVVRGHDGQLHSPTLVHQQPAWLCVDTMVSSTRPPSCTNSLPGCVWTRWSAPHAYLHTATRSQTQTAWLLHC